jgi:RNA polymerase sigma-70 factor, ECF subfamily
MEADSLDREPASLLRRDSAPAPMTGIASVSDAELAVRIAAGDEEAFGAAYDRHVGVVFGATARYLRDPASAEEVVQDVFVNLWRYADRYEPASGTLAGWLLKIARNKAIDALRSTARRPRFTPVGDGQAAGLEAALEHARPDHDLDGPDTIAVRAWTRAVVRAALSLMPDSERTALQLAYDEGLTQPEIAERTGWPLGTVKTRTRRALANLRTALEAVPDLTEEAEAR